jgi:hypothetical protein
VALKVPLRFRCRHPKDNPYDQGKQTFAGEEGN